jgi:hypothetical protein
MGSGTPIERLAAAAGRDFPNLLKARERTATGLAERRAKLDALDHDADASVVLMGSWGRAEVTTGSDDDFMVLVDGSERGAVKPSVDDVKSVLDAAPGDQGTFGTLVFCENLIENIGLDADSNSNLTQRMLFLLESVAVTAQEVHNDIVRYWRTMCVDFAGKERRGRAKWGLRNAKLRTSRKVLFAGGLLPVLDCYRLDRVEMLEFLGEQFDLPPTDRIAEAFLRNHHPDAGARTLGAYDDFLGRLGDQSFRSELHALTRDASDQSNAFDEVRRIGHDLQAGLVALLFESETPLPKVVREYAIF